MNDDQFMDAKQDNISIYWHVYGCQARQHIISTSYIHNFSRLYYVNFKSFEGNGNCRSPWPLIFSDEYIMFNDFNGAVIV